MHVINRDEKASSQLTPFERTEEMKKDKGVEESVSILGLNEEEVAFGIQYAAGPHMGNQQRSYKAAFPDATDNYASSRSSDLMKRERVLNYIKMVSVALMERLIVQEGGVERLEDWREDAAEAKRILRAARRRMIRLTSVESENLRYAINRALGTPLQVSDVTTHDEAATIQALGRYAQRIAETKKVREDLSPVRRGEAWGEPASPSHQRSFQFSSGAEPCKRFRRSH